MKNAKIFLVEGKRKLTPMTETAYEREDDLQALLADYPDLLPGDQIDPENPRRWLLVARELGVPGSEEETGRWSLDHLFLDQDGTPTFVECKRAADTRARREVVAQICQRQLETDMATIRNAHSYGRREAHASCGLGTSLIRLAASSALWLSTSFPNSTMML